eukprot:13603951-Alexandrium_andersonii.AAC.1
MPGSSGTSRPAPPSRTASSPRTSCRSPASRSSSLLGKAAAPGRRSEAPLQEVERSQLLTGRGVLDAVQEMPIASGSMDTAMRGSSAAAAPTGRGKGFVVDMKGALPGCSVRGPAAAAAPTGRGRGSGVLDTAEPHYKSKD